MKSPITVILIAAAVCCALPLVFGSTDAPSQSPEVGRFALESGEYLAPSHAAERRLPGIFKIDTVTGETWIYKERINTQSVLSNEIIGEWMPVD